MPIHVTVDEAATPYGPIYLAATERGLCRTTIPGETYDELLSWLERKLRTADIAREPGALAETARPVVAFLESGEPIPDLPLDMIGTPFQRAVWEAVLEIPYGETRTYVEIARTIGHPLAPRAVGAANAINPLPFVVPCHRVVGADGAIKGYPGGIVNRAMLLRLEGWWPTEDGAPARYTDR